MIVDTMKLEEIHKELHEDFRNTRAQLNNRVEKFKGVVLKSSRFPVRRHYECKSLQKKNRFYVQLTALKRGEFKNSLFDYYCIFDRPEGLYLACLDLKLKSIRHISSPGTANVSFRMTVFPIWT